MGQTLKNKINKKTLADNWTAGSLITVSSFVLIGWILDVRSITSIQPEWVTMKFATAFSFLICGFMVIFKDKPNLVKYLSGFVGSIVISSILSTFFDHANAGFFPGLEAHHSQMTLAPGFPSWATLLCFTLISLNVFMGKKSRKNAGLFVLVVSSVAVLGYLLDASVMYYYAPDISTAMAFHTAILMGHMGTFQYIQAKKI